VDDLNNIHAPDYFFSFPKDGIIGEIMKDSTY